MTELIRRCRRKNYRKRSGKFENVITVGMRGEADSAIMGEQATLADNINLLRDVLRTQNRLIKEHVNEDLDKVPRMLALYKEVEPFFYGDAQTQGLKYSELKWQEGTSRSPGARMV